jgi:hypothetical protein
MHVHPEPLQELEGGDADLWEEGVDVAGDEEPYFHPGLEHDERLPGDLQINDGGHGPLLSV